MAGSNTIEGTRKENMTDEHRFEEHFRRREETLIRLSDEQD